MASACSQTYVLVQRSKLPEMLGRNVITAFEHFRLFNDGFEFFAETLNLLRRQDQIRL